MNALSYLGARLKEASTWAGIAIMGEAFGQAADYVIGHPACAPYGHAVAIVAAAAAGLLKEGTPA